MKTKAWLAVAFLFAVLTVAACDQSDVSDDSPESGTCGVAVLGPTPVPETIAPRMTVRRGFTDIAHNSTYDIGARGWSVPGPLVDFQIINNSRTTITLDTNPAAVVVSGAHNATIDSLSQPQTVIPAGASTSFTIVFKVEERGDFEFAVSISNHGSFSSDFFFVVSGKGQEQFGYSKTITAPNTYGVFVNGSADGNAEQRYSSLDNAKGTTFSPNGRFGAAVVGDFATVFSTATGNSVQVLQTIFNQFSGDQFAWVDGPNGVQYLSIVDKESYEAAPHLYTCVVSGNATPQVTGLTRVTLQDAPSYSYRVGKATWSSNGGRLAFHLARVPFDPLQPGYIWACAFTGVPGVARQMASVHAHETFNRFEWAAAQTPGDVLVFQQTWHESDINYVNVTLNSGLLYAGTVNIVAETAARWAISPNGNRIAYVDGIPGVIESHPYAYSFSTGGDPVSLLTNATPGNFYHAVYATPQWSPDGRIVAYTGTFTTADDIDMYVQRLTAATGPIVRSGDTINMSVGVPGIVISDFAFSPEGTRLVYHSSDYGIPTTRQRIILATIESTPQHTLIHDRSIPYEHHWFFLGLKFSPRGDFVSWLMHPPETAYSWRLHVVPLSGPRLTVAAEAYEASADILGFGVEQYRWLR
ncbi:MAG: hypothetical protein IT462_06065 [Planctomycetes bacterium]|nr:hypothetical protein [Planctomycetota bacterium]